jgi:demethylmenaquinone methyltransferase/2-methoxy-6-polyprenyl-1,4-benzoquinol methylase
VYCVDENKGMLDLNKRKFKGNTSVKWFCNSAEKLPFKNNHFDYYTISFGIRNVSNLNNALKEAYRVLKPGGRFLCLEFSKVKNKILNRFYKTYSKSIPQIGKFIVGKSEPYEYLINSIEKFHSQEKFIKQIKKQNFINVSYRNLSGGIVAIHSAWKI